MSAERWASLWLAVAVASMFALGVLLSSVKISVAQEMHHPPQDMELHEKFYSTWMMPDRPEVSCCGKGDCYPTEAHMENGHWVAKRREDGAWIKIPDAKVEHNRDNPDGRNHICAPVPYVAERSGTEVYCFTPGGGA